MKTQTHILNLALAAFALLTTTTSCLNDTPRDRIEEEQAISSPSSLWINSVGRLYNCIGSNEEGKGLQGTYRAYTIIVRLQPMKPLYPLGEPTGTMGLSGNDYTPPMGRQRPRTVQPLVLSFAIGGTMQRCHRLDR